MEEEWIRLQVKVPMLVQGLVLCCSDSLPADLIVERAHGRSVALALACTARDRDRHWAAPLVLPSFPTVPALQLLAPALAPLSRRPVSPPISLTITVLSRLAAGFVTHMA